MSGRNLPARSLFLSTVVVLLGLVVACGSSAPAANQAFVQLRLDTPTPIPTPTQPPSPTPTPSPPELTLDDTLARQGGFFTVALSGAPSAVGDVRAYFNGSSYRLLPRGSDWVGAVGLAMDIETGYYSVEVKGEGLETLTGRVLVDPYDFPVDYLTLPPDSSGLLVDSVAILQENALLARIYSAFTTPVRWSGAWIKPVAGPITNIFGTSRSINGGPLSPHTGTDIAADEATPVMAAASGKVAYAGLLYLRGGSIVIDHGGGVFSGYHHLSGFAVEEGQLVRAGDLIGYVGATGLADGPHLHWEAIVQGVRVDAMLFTKLR
ncbi:MAG TPA: M23 family metallopeptidase [Dehalococcoidia bacterium]|nr:M23 family metallopeptidase [Dehalococcoidia bacterium]